MRRLSNYYTYEPQVVPKDHCQKKYRRLEEELSNTQFGLCKVLKNVLFQRMLHRFREGLRQDQAYDKLHQLLVLRNLDRKVG